MTTKTCSTCQQEQPFEQFPRKRNARSTKCKTCTRAYSKSHYATHRTERIAQTSEYSRSSRRQRREHIERLSSFQLCDTCHTHPAPRQDSRGHYRTLMLGITPAGDTINELANAEASLPRFLAALRQPLVWRCSPCHASRARAERPAPLRERIIEEVRAGQSTPNDIFLAVRDALPSTTLNSVYVTLCDLTASDRLVRVGRGRYRPASSDSARG